jgi:hypothetical protein
MPKSKSPRFPETAINSPHPPEAIDLNQASKRDDWGRDTIGTGFEYGFAPNWSVGVEYDYLWRVSDSQTSLTPGLEQDGRIYIEKIMGRSSISSAFASSHGARIHTSRSSSVVNITGIGLHSALMIIIEAAPHVSVANWTQWRWRDRQHRFHPRVRRRSSWLCAVVPCSEANRELHHSATSSPLACETKQMVSQRQEARRAERAIIGELPDSGPAPKTPVRCLRSSVIGCLKHGGRVFTSGRSKIAGEGPTPTRDPDMPHPSQVMEEWMNAPLWEQQELNKAHKRQERDTEAFRDTGVRVPEPVLGQSDLEYGQESCRMFKRTFLPQNWAL